MVLLLLLGGIMYYVVFAKFYIDYLDTGRDDGVQYGMASEWASKYGNTIDDSECAQIAEEFESAKGTFASQLSSVPEAASYGISSYDDYISFTNTYLEDFEAGIAEEDEAVLDLMDDITSKTNLLEVQVMDETISEHERMNTTSLTSLAEELKGDEASRLAELDNSDIKYGYIPSALLDATTGLGTALVLWISISIIILLSPTVVRDRLNRVQNLQYSSRAGRRIFSVQVAASLISGMLLTLVHCLALGLILLAKGVFVFKDFYIFTSEYIPWVDWTYGKYILVLALMCIAIGMCVTLLTVFFSRFSKTYIGMLLKGTLLMVGLINFYGMLPTVTRPFYMFNPMGLQLHFKGQELIFLLILILVSVTLIGTSLISHRKKELI